jgi:hypothetical protein
MKNAQASKTGRGLYSLTNSLAQSTFDTRNIGMVNRGMASAGMGMGQGLKQNYDQRFAEREKEMKQKASYIKDPNVRSRYLDQMTDTAGQSMQRTALRAFGLKGQDGRSDADIIKDNITKGRQNTAEMYRAIQDPAKKLAYYQEHKAEIDAWQQDQGNSAVRVGSPLSLREERLEKVAAGRAEQVSRAKENLQLTGDYLQTTRTYEDETNAKYDKELEELAKSAPNSLILGADGKPMKGTPSQAQIDEIEARRAKALEADKEYVQDAARTAQETIGELEKAQRKQQQSAERAAGTTTTAAESSGARYDSKEYEKPAYLRNPGTSAGAQAIHGQPSSSAAMTPAQMEEIKTKLKTVDFAGKMREKKAGSGAAATV